MSPPARASAGTRFAVDAYVRFVRERTLLEAVASSLTELFAPAIIRDRVAGMLANYDFVSRDTLAYFNTRLDPGAARRGFRPRLCEARRPARRTAAGGAASADLQMRRAVGQLDALHYAYVEPGHIPPGAFVPGARKAAS